MSAISSTPTLASVIVLKIQAFAGKPVAEQARLKAQLEALVSLAIRPVASRDRIVLDTADGLAVVVLGNPKEALAVAERSQAAAADLSLCVGLNQGPVKLAPDAGGGPALLGDALAAGMMLSNAATPGRLVASRSFHEALDQSAPERAADLTAAGTFTDASVRTHEVFTLDRRTALARRRRLIAGTVAAVVAVLGLGITGRMFLQQKPALPAVIQFEIAPRGDVFIDGVLKGRAPPLKRIEVSPGPHTIEVRNPPFPPLTVDVNPGSAEELTISHTFASPKASPKSAPRGGPPKSKDKSVDDYIRDLRRQLGF